VSVRLPFLLGSLACKAFSVDTESFSRTIIQPYKAYRRNWKTISEFYNQRVPSSCGGVYADECLRLIIRTPLHLLHDVLKLPNRTIIKQEIPAATYDRLIYNSYLSLFSANCLLYKPHLQRSLLAKTSRKSLLDLYKNLLSAHFGVGSPTAGLFKLLKHDFKLLLPNVDLTGLSEGEFAEAVDKAAQDRFPDSVDLQLRLSETCHVIQEILQNSICEQIANLFDLHYGVLDAPQRFTRYYEIDRTDTHALVPDHRVYQFRADLSNARRMPDWTSSKQLASLLEKQGAACRLSRFLAHSVQGWHEKKQTRLPPRISPARSSRSCSLPKGRKPKLRKQTPRIQTSGG
jgi:hypothetical protein